MMLSPFTNNWKLQKKHYTRSIYDGKMKLNEYPDMEKLNAFITNKMGIKYSEKHPQRKHYDDEQQHIQKYNARLNKKENKIQIKVNFPKHRWGRVKPIDHLSLSVFHRPTRHALCKDIYVDIDMVNASQKIFYEICLQNNRNPEKIGIYCDKREEILREIIEHHKCSRKIAKTLPIALSFGGSYKEWLKTNEIINPDEKMDFIVELEKEYAGIMDVVYENNKIIIEDVEKADPFKFDKFSTEEGRYDAKKRTCMSLFYQTIERHLQEAMIRYLVDEKRFKLEDIVPCQDGFMILKELYYPEISQECEMIIKTKFGIRIPVIVKEFDEAMDIPLLADHEIMETNIELSINFDGIENPILSLTHHTDDKGIGEYDIAKVLHHYYKDQYVCASIQDNVWYSFKNHRWIKCEAGYSLRNIISEEFRNKFLASKVILLEKKKGLNDDQIKILTAMINRVADLLLRLSRTNDKKNIMTEAKELFYNPKFEEQLNTNTHLLCFNNGVMDFRTMEFSDGKPEDMISLCTNIDWLEFNDEELEYLKDVRKRLFYKPLGKPVGKYFIRKIAFALAGKRQKNLLFGLGNTNAGKSTICSGCKLSFGDYAGEFNAENLSYRNTSNDEAQQLRWALLLRHKRIIFSNEMKSTVELNGNMIKKISSGCDAIIGRRHCMEETPFIPDFLAIVWQMIYPV